MLHNLQNVEMCKNASHDNWVKYYRLIPLANNDTKQAMDKQRDFDKTHEISHEFMRLHFEEVQMNNESLI